MQPVGNAVDNNRRKYEIRRLYIGLSREGAKLQGNELVSVHIGSKNAESALEAYGKE